MAKEKEPKAKGEQPRGVEEARRYFEEIAQVFVQPLQAQGLLQGFTTNSALLGDYGEAWIRELVVKMLPGLRVSTGTMVRPTDRRESATSTPQIDILIWDPSWMPAVFECGDFAVVRTQSVRGIIEVKRSLGASEIGLFRLSSG